MKFFKHAAILIAILSAWLPAGGHAAGKPRLDVILERGTILVGTTGDYQPFCYLNPKTGKYEGYDIDAARKLGRALGVEVRFIKTTWATLVPGILEGKYDIAMCGITRTLARQKQVGLTEPYMTVGKSALIRKVDRARFKTMMDIDRPGVKIGVNPGGTNEQFVRANIEQAQIVVIPDNLEIPGKIATGVVDLMITDNVEAMLFAHQRPDLFAVSAEKPFTREDFGYVIPRDAPLLLNWLNLWIHQMKEQGEFTKLAGKWIAK